MAFGTYYDWPTVRDILKQFPDNFAVDLPQHRRIEPHGFHVVITVISQQPHTRDRCQIISCENLVEPGSKKQREVFESTELSRLEKLFVAARLEYPYEAIQRARISMQLRSIGQD